MLKHHKPIASLLAVTLSKYKVMRNPVVEDELHIAVNVVVCHGTQFTPITTYFA